MYISLDNIRTLFPGTPSILKESSERPPCLTGWVKLQDAPSSLLHRLYVCEYEDGVNEFPFLPHMSILCLVKEWENPEKLSERFPASVNVLLLKNEQPENVYAALDTYFDMQCGIGLYAESLLDILFTEGGIQAMVDHAYAAFGNPIFVFDAGFNLIAANWEQAQKMNVGTELLENKGFSNNEFAMANSRDHIHERVRKSDVPIAAYNPDLGYDQLLCTIDTKKDLGHIVVSAANQPLKSMDIQLLQILRKCIDQQLKKDEFIRNTKGFNYEYFLKDLLDGKIATGKTFLDRLDYVGVEFTGNMYCLVVETARSADAINTNYVRNLFESRFSNTKTLMYNGEIIVILSMPENQTLSKKHLNDAISLCKTNGLYAGLSNCFQKIIELSEYYNQALRAIELGICTADKPSLFLYEDYYLEHVKNIFAQKESSETFCHPKMKVLMEHDKKHKSELAYTLYMYLTHERIIASASEAMHMHRNSLVYRIGKITSLIGDDFESYRERQYLILSYEMNLETGPSESRTKH